MVIFFGILRKRKCGKNCGNIDKFHKQTKIKGYEENHLIMSP